MNIPPKLLAATSALVAGILWGAWAFYINLDAENVLISAGAQFLSSAIVTVLMSMIVLKSQAFFEGKFKRTLMPATISSAVAIAILITFHGLAKTENMFATILAPALVGFAYSLFYSYQLNKD